MKFKVGENLPAGCASLLREAGWEVDTAGAEGFSGIPDEVLAGHCKEANRILVTLDVEFANPFRHPAGDIPDVIVLRSKRQDKESLLAVAMCLLLALRRSAPEREIWIVQSDRIRICRV